MATAQLAIPALPPANSTRPGLRSCRLREGGRERGGGREGGREGKGGREGGREGGKEKE